MISFILEIASSDEGSTRAKGTRILIVDDEPAVLFAYRRLLEREGLEVDACERLADALQLLQARRYLAVIADMRLAGSDNADGLEILKRVRCEWPATRVILATGYGSSAVATTARELGASHYFVKPVPPSVILEALREASDTVQTNLA